MLIAPQSCRKQVVDKSQPYMAERAYMSKLRKKRSHLKTYNLADESGKLLGKITFNPNDADIVKRFDKVMKRLEDFLKKTDEEQSKDINGFIYDNIDYLLDEDNSKEIFSILKPSAVLESGQYFFEQILSVIGTIIEKENRRNF